MVQFSANNVQNRLTALLLSMQVLNAGSLNAGSNSIVNTSVVYKLQFIFMSMSIFMSTVHHSIVNTSSFLCTTAVLNLVVIEPTVLKALDLAGRG